MKISTRSEYGVRLLIVLARAGDAGPLSLNQVARAEKLPHDYLEQLVGDLRRAGLLTASRGQSGGYRLGRSAEEISVADVVRAVEGSVMEMPCAGTATLEACDRPQPCSVHDVYQRLFESVDGALASSTLAELAASSGGPPYPVEVRRRVRAASNANPTA